METTQETSVEGLTAEEYRAQQLTSKAIGDLIGLGRKNLDQSTVGGQDYLVLRINEKIVEIDIPRADYSRIYSALRGTVLHKI